MSAAKENNADLAVADKVDGNEKTNSETQQNRLYKGTKRQGDVSVQYSEVYSLYISQLQINDYFLIFSGRKRRKK